MLGKPYCLSYIPSWNLYIPNSQFLYYSIVHPYYKGSTDEYAVVLLWNYLYHTMRFHIHSMNQDEPCTDKYSNCLCYVYTMYKHIYTLLNTFVQYIACSDMYYGAFTSHPLLHIASPHPNPNPAPHRLLPHHSNSTPLTTHIHNCHSIHDSLCQSFSLSVSVSHSISLWQSRCLCLAVSLSVSLSLPVSHPVSLSVFVSPLSLSVAPSLCLCQIVTHQSLCLCHSVSHSPVSMSLQDFKFSSLWGG